MPNIDSIKPGDLLPLREFKPDHVQSFLYNAVLFNAHRIHFDYQYTTQVEKYPELVVPGPLMGDWLTQCVIEWIGEDGQLASIEYSNRKAAYVGETLHSGGRVISCDYEKREVTLELFVKNKEADILTPGTAVVRL